MSSMKSGFSTLNRWLGKKNKDKNTTSGKLSKSNTNLSSLSVSSMNINETSQLEYNRITPLPAATSNAPFEQTFRITVLLPRDQLYVARLGARVPLSKLLELVCDNKLLDPQKYEFRNPVDSSQVYSCDLTIGAVGLSEIRLCHKSESYDNFNTEEVIKLHRTTIIRDSLSSSSEFSSRNSKLTTKTPSPYSSNNSLNSMDSTGMNYTRTPVTLPAALTANSKKGLSASQKKLSGSTTTMTAPPRKKRVAPRPPSQIVIPEKSALVITTTTTTTTSNKNSETAAVPVLNRREMCVSTPNLASASALPSPDTIDCNGNLNNNNSKQLISNGIHNQTSDDEEVIAMRKLEAQRNTRNSYAGIGSVQTLHTNSVQHNNANSNFMGFPEPAPRKRMIHVKKKVAPAPPPRGSGLSDDVISIASTTISMSAFSEPDTSVIYESPNLTKRELQQQQHLPDERQEPVPRMSTPNNVSPIPKPVPRSTTTSSSMINSTSTTSEMVMMSSPTPGTVTLTMPSPSPLPPPVVESPVRNNNISKVLLNRTPTPEPRSLTSEPSLETSSITAVDDHDHDDNASKQADSGIGELVPSPLPDSLPPSEGSTQECKSTFESSSDDDEMIKVYNFKLGKTVVQPLLTNGDQPALEELRLLAGSEITDSKKLTSAMSQDSDSVDNSQATTTPITGTSAGATEMTSWNFTIPISPPPNFADTDSVNEIEKTLETRHTIIAQVTVGTDEPITPKIMERPMLNFKAIAPKQVQEYIEEPPTVLRSLSKSITENKEEPLTIIKPPPKPITPQQQQQPSKSNATPTPTHENVLDELLTIIQENRIDTLIKKSDADGEIEAAKPNTLTNFSIGAAASTKATSKASKESNTESATATPPVKPATPESLGNEREKLYRRNSSTQQQQRRRSITRADSFQATAKLGETLNGLLNRRSSSQLSLTKLEQNSNGIQSLNCRRSSSELSIGESPTLQSPEVIKTILGSRKNSLANISDSEMNNNNHNNTDLDKSLKVAPVMSSLEQNRTATREETSPNKPKNVVASSHTGVTVITKVMESKTKLDEPSLSSASSLTETMATTVTKPQQQQQQQPKEVPKTYRYSGPPSINFSTWNERPKVQVSIKNEGDYIFGGHHANRHSTAVSNISSVVMNHEQSKSSGGGGGGNGVADSGIIESSSKTQQLPAREQEKLTIDTAAPILRMGIPRKEYKVPITVKPLRDVSVETIELPVTSKQPKSLEFPNAKTKRLTSTIEIGGSGESSSNVKILNVLRHQHQHQNQNPIATSTLTPYNATTLPRAAVNPTNRFSIPTANPGLLRATATSKTILGGGDSQIYSGTSSMTTTGSMIETAAATPEAPFGQSTLRRTGYKEKMLAREQEEHERAMRKSVPVSTNTNGGGSASSSAAVKNPKMIVIKSAKLELKLQQNNNNNNNHEEIPILRSKTNTPIVLRSIHDSMPPQASAQASPPPPPPPAAAAALPTLKPLSGACKPSTNQQPSSTTPTPTDSPRDQLLDAIRNFNRGELNRT